MATYGREEHGMATMEQETTELPVTGEWSLYQSHSSIEFVAKHLMVTKVRGSFTDFEGAIHVAEEAGDSWAEATMKAASITTGDEKRDGHLTSGDFLETEKHPEIKYRSTSLKHVKDNRYEAEGDLTIKGITKPVTLDVEYNGIGRSPWGNDVAFFSATGEINREDYGMTWNQALESGGVLVGKKVRIEIEAQAVRK
jgi:polyisoprenoid-binding protein YceI